jgi:hypothetical protein
MSINIFTLKIAKVHLHLVHLSGKNNNILKL